MTLWIILTLIVALSVAVLTVPLVRRYDARPTGDAASRRVLADQLADIDAQARAGTVSAAEAEALRVETKRRLLSETAADRPARALGSGALGQIAVAVAVLVTLGGTLLYSRLGSPETEMAGDAAPAAAPAAPGAAPAAGGDAAVMQLVASLEARLKANPADVEGWRMLGWSRYSLGQFAAAADAYSHAATLAPTRADLQSALGEALSLAANGTVTPAASTAFAKAVAADPADARARYFQGVARDQAGDHAGAVNAWVTLLKSAPPGAPWAADVRRTLTQVAGQAGISLTGRLPADTAAATVAPAPLGSAPATVGAIPQPSESQTAAVRAMAPDAQAAMIRQMVDGLAARLKTNPQDPDGWLRLIRARMVQGDTPAAVAAKEQALASLTNPGQRAAVADGAKALGVPGPERGSAGPDRPRAQAGQINGLAGTAAVRPRINDASPLHHRRAGAGQSRLVPAPAARPPRGLSSSPSSCRRCPRRRRPAPRRGPAGAPCRRPCRDSRGAHGHRAGSCR